MKRKTFIALIACVIIGLSAVSVSAASPKVRYTRQTGNFQRIPNVAFQGNEDKRYGWPVRVSGFDEAIEKARELNLNAFHFYLTGDARGQMYPFDSVVGYEPRGGGSQSIGVIMERTSVHAKADNKASDQ